MSLKNSVLLRAASAFQKLQWVSLIIGTCIFPYIVFGNHSNKLLAYSFMAMDRLAIIIFSYLNRLHVDRRVRNRSLPWTGISTAILVVGYREEPAILEGCLKSLAANRYKPNQQILFVIDGNKLEDEYMADIFLKVYSNGTVLRPEHLLENFEEGDKEMVELISQINSTKGPVCVMQAHHGKRSAMFTGFTLLQQKGVEAVVVTDSDTFLHPDAVTELAFALDESPTVGAVTGDIRIHNTSTWLTFLCSVRYWFAFNMDRGADSYFGSVNCISGPLGIYRMSIIKQVMKAWLRQTFLGARCNYGDDRHLTNLVLKKGYSVKFSHAAICYTDSPPQFIGWVTQQTRWCKSFFRELPIQLSCLHLHSPWMAYRVIVMGVSSWTTTFLFLHVIFSGTRFQLLLWTLSFIFVAAVNTCYALALTRDRRYLFTIVYGVLYLFGYLPAKINAAFTIHNNSWGTSPHSLRGSITKFQNYFAPIGWYLIIVYGLLIHNPQRFLPSNLNPKENTDAILMCTLSLFGLLYLLLLFWVFKRNGQLNKLYIRDFTYEELFSKK